MIDLDALSPMEVTQRATLLRESLPQAGCDALLVTNPVNIRYLSGFTGSAGILAVLADHLVLVTDGRYRDQAPLEAARAGVDIQVAIAPSAQSQRQALVSACRSAARLGLEASALTWATQRRYESEWFADHELIATEGLIESFRAVKDEGEIARIAAACAIADSALEDVKPRLLEGATERDIAIELDFAMRRSGASGPSFETIVASGENGARPHARPSGRAIREGDLVVLDFGAVVDGYCSDMSRTVVIGEPSPIHSRMLEVVAAGQATGVGVLEPGIACSAVDHAARSVITDAGWGEAFLHGTGHGVGLDIHEEPRVSGASTATLAVGNVVTVEPGVYLADHGGVRIEDTLVITSQGARPLTLAPKDPVLL